MKTLLVFLALSAAPAFAQVNGQSVCNQQAPITITTSGTSTIAASIGGQSIHVCHISFALSAAVNVKLQAVGASTTDLTGAYQGISTLSLDFNGALKTGAGNSLGINLSGVATAGGVVTYYQDAR